MFNVFFHEWPLVVFTILAQITAGLVFTLKVYKIKYPNSINLEDLKIISLILSIMMGCALIFSFFHLSNVFAGFYTITRIFSNWLPAEVFFLSAFTGISFLLFLLIKYNKVTIHLANLIVNLLVILAILGIVSMSGIYGAMHSTVVAWDFKYIVTLFFAVSIMLGGLMFSFMPLNNDKYDSSYRVALTGFLLFVFIFPIYMIFLGKTKPYNLMSLFDYAPLYSNLSIVGLILTIIGFSIILFKGQISKTNIKLTFILVLLGQLVIRALFYSLINTHLM